MKAQKLFKILERDFVKPGMKDDWGDEMSSIREFLTKTYKKRSIGIVFDFAKEVNQVFTAVDPSPEVMRNILSLGISDALLFVHHPAIWNINLAPQVFSQMDKKLVKRFKDNRISIYNLHAPLDSFGIYSTSVSLARSLNISSLKPFAEYSGVKCGVTGITKVSSALKLKESFSKAVGHCVKLYPYGTENIKDKRVAIIAGGGNSVNFLSEVAEKGINTFITGISVKNSHSAKVHEFAKANKINIIGGTHYSTEKFACIAMCDYFKTLGLPSTFIKDKPYMEDI